MPRKVHPFYNFNRVLSHNGVYNFVVGGRGLGKTYGAKRRALVKAIKEGEQFIYLRRYKSELVARSTFFADIAQEFPGQDFRTNGNVAQMAPTDTKDDKKRQWQTIGYFVSLSTAQSQKSISFPLVTLIIFDEFIIEKGAIHYLPDELTVFNNFYNTVDRYQDKTKVLFLANSVSIMNPYFLGLDIKPDESKEILVSHDGFVVAHFPDSAKFAASIYETAFGRFIKNTDYADYAVGNEFADNSETLLGGKPASARYQFTLETAKGSFSVWHDFGTDDYYVQRKLPKSQIVYTLVAEKMDADKVLMLYSDKPLGYLRTAFRHGRVVFDEPTSRNAFTEVFKR